VVKPSFQLRSPRSNASNNVGAVVVATAVDSCVRVMVVIVALRGTSMKRNNLTRVQHRLHRFFRRGSLD
jgi:hypothetical protein